MVQRAAESRREVPMALTIALVFRAKAPRARAMYRPPMLRRMACHGTKQSATTWRKAVRISGGA
jgi:hypothetical protein